MNYRRGAYTTASIDLSSSNLYENKNKIVDMKIPLKEKSRPRANTNNLLQYGILPQNKDGTSYTNAPLYNKYKVQGYSNINLISSIRAAENILIQKRTSTHPESIFYSNKNNQRRSSSI